MSNKIVRCAYCGQMAKIDNCGCYKMMNVHDIPSCNCLQEAMKIESLEEFNKKKWFI